jgi:hypothetical protein
LKNVKLISLLVAVVLIAAIMVSCGGGSGSSTTVSTTSVAETTAAVLNIDTASTVDTVVGEWVDVSDSTRFANVTKASDGTVAWEDNEGKYTTTFKDGALTINVSDTETATAFFDAKTSELVCVFGGQETRFKKK